MNSYLKVPIFSHCVYYLLKPACARLIPVFISYVFASLCKVTEKNPSEVGFTPCL